MKVFLTEATGYIGSVIAEKLQAARQADGVMLLLNRVFPKGRSPDFGSLSFKSLVSQASLFLKHLTQKLVSTAAF